MKKISKNIRENQQGFISVVALGIFALLSISGLTVYETTFNTFESLKNTNNYYHAQDMANSVGEYLKYEINSHEYGFNQKITCGYGKFADKNSNADVCKELEIIAKNEQGVDQNVRVEMEIKGRAEEKDKFKGDCGLDANNCFVVPMPGTGSAGKRCNVYTPDLSDVTAKVDHNGKVSKQGVVKQSEYSCNWNKLTFGSSLTDRVAIPLYYDAGDKIVNPYNKAENGTAKDFVLRLRTPCLPCAEKPVKGKTRKCGKKETDPTICKAGDRYVLDATKSNDIVVQWQLTGTCIEGGKETECGLIPYDGGILTKIVNSKMTEKYINDEINIKGVVLSKIKQGLNTSTFPAKNTPIIEKKDNLEDQTPLLPTMKKPIFTLMLSNKLLTEAKDNIPYLEYQLLTDQPVASPVMTLTSQASFNGNSFKDVVTKNVERPLVDFAIQN